MKKTMRVKATALRLDHLAFPCFEVAATSEFYSEILGLPLIESISGVSPEWGNKDFLMMIYGLKDGGQLAFFAIEGMQRPPDDKLPKEIRHVALSTPLVRNLDGWRDRLRRYGVFFWEEDHETQKSLYFFDPNGLVVEITCPTSQTAIPRNPNAGRAVSAWIRKHTKKRKKTRRIRFA